MESMDQGPNLKEKYTGQEFYGAMCKTAASLSAVAASAKAKLDCAKAAEADRMAHHFHVLTTAELPESHGMLPGSHRELLKP
jgi:hypothetical protein